MHILIFGIIGAAVGHLFELRMYPSAATVAGLISGVLLAALIFGTPKMLVPIVSFMFGPIMQFVGMTLFAITFTLAAWDVGGPLFGLVTFAGSVRFIRKFMLTAP